MIWHHKKYGQQQYKGSYERDAKGERVFVLSCVSRPHRITFESWQMAKALGWKHG